jgi:outer membrane protein assembly factor BamB
MLLRSQQHSAVVVTLLVLLAGTAADGDNWPGWRGIAGDGVSLEENLPTEWDRQTNVRWRVELPEAGNSTPIVWDKRVFVTQPIGGGKRRTVICFDRETGRQLWQAGVDAVEMEPTHETNPYCSPSPVTDGERVIAWFGSSGLAAFDFEGQLLWRRSLGSVQHVFGYGASPVLHGDLCFLNFGPGRREFGVAVNKVTGEIVWQYDAPKSVQQNAGGRDIDGMWSTPLVVDDVVIFCFRDTVTAFEPTTGKQEWTCHGIGLQSKASPVAGEGIVVSLGGKDSSTFAIRLGGKGDVSESHVIWKYQQAKSRLGTGVIHDGHFYVNRRNGIVECIELETGKVVWEKRHSGPGRTSDTWSSLTLAGGKIYAVNQSADVFVLEASPIYQLLATNSLHEHTNASIAVSQGSLFVRTQDALWCIGD